jgi:hypothetical protein
MEVGQKGVISEKVIAAKEKGKQILINGEQAQGRSIACDILLGEAEERELLPQNLLGIGEKELLRDGGDTFLRNVGNHLQYITRRHNPEDHSPLTESSLKKNNFNT